MSHDDVVFEETSKIAIIPFAGNTIHIEPIVLDGVGEKFVRCFGAWRSVRTLRYARIEKLREKTVLNTSTLALEPSRRSPSAPINCTFGLGLTGPGALDQLRD